MSKSTITPSTRAFLLGMLSGARSATPLAMLALRHDQKVPSGTWRSWPVFRSDVGRGALVTAAVGELIADKLPRTPSRIGVGPLLGRALSGAVVGLAIVSDQRSPELRTQGAILGAIGAVAGSFAGYLGRKALGRLVRLPDTAVALVEDAVTIVGTTRVLNAE